ncbi:MAG: YggT family protein [Chloroflexi bacterium]|uniref:YggT family protein n=1 Tax=Candidatus Chlorohelix allophototropha TaxID=3003348 RepID=A0A8T7M947_9CHLR|nr:YggT family protein [Chloroflexota bacterium]WJW68580.1 YggT family protein [Chloroflexota bacterium L227-S17]
MDSPLDPQRRGNLTGDIVIDSNPPVNQPPLMPDQPIPQPINNQRNYSQAGNASVETVRQSYYDPTGALVEKQEQVVDDPFTRRNNILERTTQIIYFVLGILEVLLALRVLLRFISADNGSGFANFIYNFSAPFVAPFNGIFNNDQVLNRVGVIEFSTLLAMVIYSLFAYGMVRLLYIVFEPNRSSKEIYSTSSRRKF